MTRQEIINAIEKNASSCPYEATDIIGRVAMRRPVSAGMIRWLEQVASGASEVIKNDNPVTASAVDQYRKAERD